jgi:hypothetical protein
MRASACLRCSLSMLSAAARTAGSSDWCAMALTEEQEWMRLSGACLPAAAAGAGTGAAVWKLLRAAVGRARDVDDCRCDGRKLCDSLMHARSRAAAAPLRPASRRPGCWAGW